MAVVPQIEQEGSSPWYFPRLPFTIGKPFLRRPRGDSRRTAEQKHEDEARRTAEIAERRAVFDANDNDEGWA